jgi:hypothetical protein
MTENKTLVYFELECTWLRSFGRPRITELSFVAVNVQDFPHMNETMLSYMKQGDKNVESLQLQLPAELSLAIMLDVQTNGVSF